MRKVLDSQQMDLQQPPLWESCILYGWRPACTLKYINTLLGESAFLLLDIANFEIFDFRFSIFYIFFRQWKLRAYGTGVMWLKLRHGAKVKEELELDVIGFWRTMPLVKLLEEQRGALLTFFDSSFFAHQNKIKEDIERVSICFLISRAILWVHACTHSIWPHPD